MGSDGVIFSSPVVCYTHVYVYVLSDVSIYNYIVRPHTWYSCFFHTCIIQKVSC